VTPWAKEWFERELITIQVEGPDGAVVSVERVISVDGDVELGRRKSKYVRVFSVALLPTLFRRCHASSELCGPVAGTHFSLPLRPNYTDNAADLYYLQVDHDL
jgi:activator of Hsp90 ATPase-like protein